MKKGQPILQRTGQSNDDLRLERRKESGQHADRMIDKGDKICIFEETSELPVRAVCGGKRAGKTKGKTWSRDEQTSWIFCDKQCGHFLREGKKIAVSEKLPARFCGNGYVQSVLNVKGCTDSRRRTDAECNAIVLNESAH